MLIVASVEGSLPNDCICGIEQIGQIGIATTADQCSEREPLAVVATFSAKA